MGFIGFRVKRTVPLTVQGLGLRVAKLRAEVGSPAFKNNSLQGTLFWFRMNLGDGKMASKCSERRA